MITVVDLQISNIGSVVRALRRVGSEPEVTTDASTVAEATVIVLPGVGAFGDGMASLRAKDLVAPIRAAAKAGTPVLGICLGMQLLADSSDEHGRHQGLGLVGGHVERLQPQEGAFRVPNVGWCDLCPVVAASLIPESVHGRSVYFTHSFHLRCGDPGDLAATIRFGDTDVAAAIQRGNLLGVQFHPERSQDVGLTVLASMLEHAGVARRPTLRG